MRPFILWGIYRAFLHLPTKPEVRFADRQAFELQKLFAVRWQIKEATKVVEIFKPHMPGIVEALIHLLSGYAGRKANGKIQEVKLAGRGYKAFKNFRSTILFFLMGLNLYPPDSGEEQKNIAEIFYTACKNAWHKSIFSVHFIIH